MESNFENTRIPNFEKVAESAKLQESLDKRPVIDRIPQEELFVILKEVIDITFYKNLHDNGMKDFEFIDFLKTKTNSEILDFLDDISRNSGDNSYIIELRANLNSREFLDQLHKIKKSNILAKTSQELGNPDVSQSEKIYLEAFRMLSFLRSETAWRGLLKTDFYQHDLHYSDIVENQDFQKFVANFEKIFGGEVGWNLHLLVNIYNNDTISDKYFHTEEGLQLLKNWVEIIERNFWKNFLSLEEELYFVANNILGDILNSDFEQKMQRTAEIFTKLEKLGILLNNNRKLDFMTRDFTRVDLRRISEFIDKNQDIFAIISATPLAANLQISDFNRLIQTERWSSFENKNDLENGRTIIEEHFNGDQTGYDLSRVFSLISADIRDVTLLNTSLSESQILENFKTFVASQKSITTIETFLLAWKNFAKQSFSDKILTTENADVEKIKLLFPRNNIMLGNNYANLQDFIREDKTEELYNFLANTKALSSVNIDYIPTINEFKNNETVLQILKNFANISTKISLSDVFLTTHRSEMVAILLDTKTPEKLQNLAKLYGIDISDFANISQYDARSRNIAGNITYEKDGFLYFLEMVLDDSFYNFLISNVSQNKKFINYTEKPNLIILSGLRQYMTNEVLIEEDNFLQNFEPKLAELWLNPHHIRSMGLYTLNELDSVHDAKIINDGKDILAYFMFKNPDQANVVIDTAKLISDKIFAEKSSEKMMELLWFIAKVSIETDEYFDGNIDELKKHIENFAKLGVKISHADELKLFFREAKFYTEFSENIKNPEFAIFYNRLSENFFKNQKTMHSLIFSFEIFKNASKNSEILAKMKNWDFSDISRVMDFFKQKFSLNSPHPYFLASASHFMENFDDTKDLLSELEKQKISINSNQIFMVKILADIFRENPEKKEIFLNVDKMREIIIKEIYSRPEYARPKVEMIEHQRWLIYDAEENYQDTSILEKRLKEMQKNYTERADISNLSLPDLWKIYLTYQWIENFDSQKLSHFIRTDMKTTTTEFGASMTFAYENGKVLPDFMPMPSFNVDDDNSYHNNWYARSFIIGTNVHFHALNLNNGNSSGPSGWGNVDGGDYKAMQQTDDFSLVITPTRTKEDGEIIINSDMYKLDGDFNIVKPDYSKFRNVDLGIRVLTKQKEGN